MKTYEIYAKPISKDDFSSYIFVKQGFNIYAAIFQFFWALYKRIWPLAVIFFIINISYGIFSRFGILDMNGNLIINFTIMVFIGYYSSDLYSLYIKKKGYNLMDVVFANDLDEAKINYLNKNQNIEDNNG